MKSKGFSAAEILVAIGIIALISLVSIPLLTNYQRTIKLKNEARLLATNLRLAQQLAITEQNIYQLKLFPLAKSYQIINSKTGQIIKTVDLDPEIAINEINIFTDDTVQFNPTGAVLETGFIVLINSKNQISTLDVKPSGYVEIIE